MSLPRRRPGGHGHVFAQSYLNAFNTGFHYAFGVAIVALVFSLVVFLANKKKLPDPKGCGRFQDDAFEGRNPAGCA